LDFASRRIQDELVRVVEAREVGANDVLADDERRGELSRGRRVRAFCARSSIEAFS